MVIAHQHSPRFLQIVEDAKKRVRETNIEDVKARMDRSDQFLLGVLLRKPNLRGKRGNA